MIVARAARLGLASGAREVGRVLCWVLLGRRKVACASGALPGCLVSGAWALPFFFPEKSKFADMCG